MSCTEPFEWQLRVEPLEVQKTHLASGTVTSVPAALSKQRPVHPSVLSSESTSERVRGASGLDDSPAGAGCTSVCVFSLVWVQPSRT